MIVSGGILFFITGALICILSVFIYRKWKYEVIHLFKMKGNILASWIIMTLGLVLFGGGFVSVLLPSSVDVIYYNELGSPQYEKVKVLFSYQDKIRGTGVSGSVKMGNHYIHNTTDETLISYSVGYGDKMYEKMKFVKIPPHSIYNVPAKPYYYFEEAPDQITIYTKDKNQKGEARWVLDFERNIDLD